jgi:hypothetical protein
MIPRITAIDELVRANQESYKGAVERTEDVALIPQRRAPCSTSLTPKAAYAVEGAPPSSQARVELLANFGIDSNIRVSPAEAALYADSVQFISSP